MCVFCPKCGLLLMPNEDKMICECGYESSGVVITDKKKKEKRVDVVEEEVEVYPIIKIECSKCGNEEAYYWTVQTRSADEPETIFYKCTKCRHQWRQY